jgi:glycosyltransferase involved in cell wall biosynthesis
VEKMLTEQRKKSDQPKHPPKKILIAHNAYQQRGGEDVVVENEAAMLRQAGYDVQTYVAHNDEIMGTMGAIRTSLSIVRNRHTEKLFQVLLDDFQPHIVHFHNTFPLLTPSIYQLCKAKGIPVVQTLHNYRLLCAGALLLRDGKPCEKCVGKNPYWGALHKCYRQSHIGSAVVAHMNSVHRRKNTWNTNVDRFIALTQFARAKFIEGGICEHKISVKPNFLPEKNLREILEPSALTQGEYGQNDKPRDYAVFVGRLSHEKGLTTLLAAAGRVDFTIRVIGDGPLMPVLRSSGLPNLEIMGWLERDEVLEHIKGAAFLVVPSLWYEGFPMTVLEALACGTPVVASRIGSLQEIIDHGQSGFHFEAGDTDALAKIFNKALKSPGHFTRLRPSAAKTFRTHYSEEVNRTQLEGLYDDLM